MRLELDAAGAGFRLVAADGLAADVAEIELLAVDGELAAVHARQVEQVAHEPLEPPRFLADRRRRLLGRAPRRPRAPSA